MGELADGGAVGFTDDGRPVVATSLMWRALQYSSITERPLAVHCEDPTLSRGGHMREGIVSAELGIGGWPSIAESVMVERDLALAAYESRTLHLMHLSARASVDALRRAHAEGVARDRRGDAAPSRAHRRGRALARPEREDEPAARRRGRPQGTRRRAPRTGRSPASPPTTRRTRGTRRRCRSRPRRSAVTGLETAFAALYTHLVEPGSSRWRRSSSGCPPARPAPTGSTPRGSRSARPANLVLLDTQASWQVTEDGFKSRSKNSWLIGEKLRGRVRATIAAGRLVHES